MEIAQIYYKAKDGRMFTDPLECEDYEKSIGIIPGSVGDLVKALERLNPEYYIFGVVMVKEKDCKSIYARCTVCLDNQLEDYVNVENLREEQRYLSETVSAFIEVLKKTDKDYPAQWMIIFSENIDMSNSGCMALHNPKVWEKKN